jgi:hypothetical protein
MENDELKNLLEQNLKKNEEILKISKDIKKFMKWQQIWSTLRFLLIFVPIILGFIYLPPIIKDLITNYRSLLGSR